MQVQLQSIGIVPAEVVVAHLPGLEEPEPDVEAECSLVDALGFQHDLIHPSIHSPHEFVEQLNAHLVPAVLLEHHQHCDVGLARVGGVDGADDAGDGGLAEVGHDGEVGPGLDEVVVGEDGVGFGQFCPEDLGDPLQFGLLGEGVKRDLVGEGALHLLGLLIERLFDRTKLKKHQKGTQTISINNEADVVWRVWCITL